MTNEPMINDQIRITNVKSQIAQINYQLQNSNHKTVLTFVIGH